MQAMPSSQTAMDFLRSLLLTLVISFLAPLGIVGLLYGFALTLGQVPVSAALGELAVDQLNAFLGTLGGGSIRYGLLTLGGVASIVGGLFDSFAFYRYQSMRGH